MDNSKIVLGLPALPGDHLPPNLYNDILVIHRAIKNLLDGVSRYTGIDAPEAVELSQITPVDTLLLGNATRLYVLATVDINAGQTVNLFDNSGNLGARLASANSATTLCHGVANKPVLVGELLEMQLLQGYLGSIGSLVIGDTYWLSPTDGLIQNIAPSAVGTVAQAIGLALAADKFALNVSLQFVQN